MFISEEEIGQKAKVRERNPQKLQKEERYDNKGPKIDLNCFCVTKITMENKQAYAPFPKFSCECLLPQMYFVSPHVFILFSSSFFDLLSFLFSVHPQSCCLD